MQTARFLALLPLLLVPAAPAQTPPSAAAPAVPAGASEAWVAKTKIMPDGVTMTADWYSGAKARATDAKAKVVFVCCHMARSSRGEYREIAPKLAAEGWDALAIDLRSGEKSGAVVNETAKSATVALGGSQGFQAAFGDLDFAIAWARELAPGAKVVLVGSSYTASLAVRYASMVDGKADLVLAFSPSECLNDWTVVDSAKAVRVPVFVTCGSGARERQNAEPIANAVPGALRHSHWPTDAAKAKHGSASLLVEDAAGRETLWKLVRELVTSVAEPKKG
ncbi:MAG: dienelactone hydrolase family protein [Planctomycetota bacterium]